MKRYNISVPKKYTKNGDEKTAWSNVGKLVRFDATGDKPESFILELNMFPETKFGVFEEKEREPKPAQATSETTEEIKPEDIPF